MELPRKIAFGGWTLDRRAGELHRHETTVRLQVQPLQILEELLQHSGELVTREQLIQRLWPKGIVDFDTGLNTAVRKLRVALGDDADTPRFIETIPRRGYRWICPIDTSIDQGGGGLRVAETATAPRALLPAFDLPPVVPQPAPLRVGVLLSVFMFAIAVIAWLLVGRNTPFDEPESASIVVLPFNDMSVEQRDEPLCNGLSEEISNWLSQLPSLRVVARSSALSFKEKHQDIRTIGKDLGVTHVLEGSCRRAGSELRVTAQLTSAHDGFHLWSKSFVMPLVNILQVEDAIARSVAEGLRMEIGPKTPEIWAARQPTQAQALELYLIARHYFHERTAEGNQRAMGFFRQAIDADGTFALAHVGLAEAHVNEIYLSQVKVSAVKDEAQTLLDEARRLRANLPEIAAAEGWLQMELGSYSKAETLLDRAIMLNPSDAVSRKYLAEVADREGRLSKAVDHYQQAIELDPFDYILYVRSCIALQGVRDFVRARAHCERASQIEPDSSWPYIAKSWLGKNEGRIDDALQWIDDAQAANRPEAEFADEKGDLELVLGMPKSARVTFEADESATAVTQQLRLGRIHVATGDVESLKSQLQQLNVESIQRFDELVELARLQHAAGDSGGALLTIAKLKSSRDYSQPNVMTPQYVRNEYAPALYLGALEYEIGNRASGERMLRELLTMLDRIEEGGALWNGLFALRAQTLAVLGEEEQAMIALRRAVDLGWRACRRAARDGYFRRLEHRADYAQLLSEVDGRIEQMRANTLKRRGNTASGA